MILYSTSKTQTIGLIMGHWIFSAGVQYNHKYCTQTKKQPYPIGYLDLKKPHLRDELDLLHFLGHYFSLCEKGVEGKTFFFSWLGLS